MPAELEQRLRPALAELRETLDTPRHQAGFLRGIRSPKANRALLHGHNAFGLLQHLSFPEVLTWLEHSA